MRQLNGVYVITNVDIEYNSQSYGLYGAVNEKDGTDAMFPAKIAASLKSIHETRASINRHVASLR
jgi:hypothetical protein